MNSHYKQLSEIEDVVQGFESCTTPKDDFTHLKHLTVAVFYLYESSEREATAKMRTGLLRFLNHHGVGESKFHETLTVFWLRILRAFMRELAPETSLVEMTNKALEYGENSRLVFDYYSEERLRSDKAREVWIEPDSKRIPGSSPSSNLCDEKPHGR